MHGHFAERMSPPPMLAKLIDDGRAGRKNGKGFYTYGGNKKEKAPDASIYKVLGITPASARKTPPAEELAERVALMMINEAALCLGEGIVRSPRDADVGAIFGLGFPPFRGGPFRWIDSVGAGNVVARLEKLAATHGPRFTPAPILKSHVGPFYK
jgi:3-hydroxyacyl-CoA dehydrogenase/enoyl-CoA hydratase/3-hydroxybutyryl-CoA epimerase